MVYAKEQLLPGWALRPAFRCVKEACATEMSLPRLLGNQDGEEQGGFLHLEGWNPVGRGLAPCRSRHGTGERLQQLPALARRRVGLRGAERAAPAHRQPHNTHLAARTHEKPPRRSEVITVPFETSSF